MPFLLHRMPFPSKPGEVVVRGERVKIRGDQIIVWVSLSVESVNAQRPATAPFPAILDTGHTHSFAISERHLTGWAGLRLESLAVLTAVRDRGQKLFLREANIWIHPNKPGQRDRLADRPPHWLEASAGVAVYPGADFPRLPLLGLRAVAENGLVLTVDGPKRQATLRTPARWWPFG